MKEKIEIKAWALVSKEDPSLLGFIHSEQIGVFSLAIFPDKENAEKACPSSRTLVSVTIIIPNPLSEKVIELSHD